MDGSIVELVCLDTLHRRCDIGLLLGTVADDHGLLEEGGLFFKCYIDDLLVSDGDFHGRITNAGEREDRIGVLDGDGVATISAGDDTVLGTDFDDTASDNRFTGGVGNSSLHNAGHRRNGGKQEKKGQREL